MAVVEQVISLFFMIVTGLLCRKTRMLTDESIRGVTQLTVNVALPALCISKLQLDFSPDILSGIILSFVAATALMILFLGVALLVFRKKSPQRRAVLAHLFAFANCGFMGYPMILSINPDYLIYAIAFNASFNLLCWTLGCMLYQKGSADTWKRALLNPAVLASTLGIALFCLKIRLPHVVVSTLDTLGSLTTPLSMLLIGTRVAGLHLRDFREMDYHIGAFMRLIVGPLLSALLLTPFHLPEPVFITCVLIMAMPGASVSAMQAELYGGDNVFAARVVAYSTLLSLVTIPIISLILI